MLPIILILAFVFPATYISVNKLQPIWYSYHPTIDPLGIERLQESIGDMINGMQAMMVREFERLAQIHSIQPPTPSVETPMPVVSEAAVGVSTLLNDEDLRLAVLEGYLDAPKLLACEVISFAQRRFMDRLDEDERLLCDMFLSGLAAFIFGFITKRALMLAIAFCVRLWKWASTSRKATEETPLPMLNVLLASPSPILEAAPVTVFSQMNFNSLTDAAAVFKPDLPLANAKPCDNITELGCDLLVNNPLPTPEHTMPASKISPPTNFPFLLATATVENQPLALSPVKVFPTSHGYLHHPAAFGEAGFSRARSPAPEFSSNRHNPSAKTPSKLEESIFHATPPKPSSIEDKPRAQRPRATTTISSDEVVFPKTPGGAEGIDTRNVNDKGPQTDTTGLKNSGANAAITVTTAVLTGSRVARDDMIGYDKGVNTPEPLTTPATYANIAKLAPTSLVVPSCESNPARIGMAGPASAPTHNMTPGLPAPVTTTRPCKQVVVPRTDNPSSTVNAPTNQADTRSPSFVATPSSRARNTLSGPRARQRTNTGHVTSTVVASVVPAVGVKASMPILKKLVDAKQRANMVREVSAAAGSGTPPLVPSSKSVPAGTEVSLVTRALTMSQMDTKTPTAPTSSGVIPLASLAPSAPIPDVTPAFTSMQIVTDAPVAPSITHPEAAPRKQKTAGDAPVDPKFPAIATTNVERPAPPSLETKLELPTGTAPTPGPELCPHGNPLPSLVSLGLSMLGDDKPTTNPKPGLVSAATAGMKLVDEPTAKSTPTCGPEIVLATVSMSRPKLTESHPIIISDPACMPKPTPLPVTSTDDVKPFPSFQVRGKWTAARLARVQSATNLGLSTVVEEPEADVGAAIPPRRRHSSAGGVLWSQGQGQKQSASENWRRLEARKEKEKEKESGSDGPVPIVNGGKENETPAATRKRRDVGEVPNWALA